MSEREQKIWVVYCPFHWDGATSWVTFTNRNWSGCEQHPQAGESMTSWTCYSYPCIPPLHPLDLTYSQLLLASASSCCCASRSSWRWWESLSSLVYVQTNISAFLRNEAKELVGWMEVCEGLPSGRICFSLKSEHWVSNFLDICINILHKIYDC